MQHKKNCKFTPVVGGDAKINFYMIVQNNIFNPSNTFSKIHEKK